VRASKNDPTKPTVLPRQILHVMLKFKFLRSKKSTGQQMANIPMWIKKREDPMLGKVILG
jgi:hypothetical protein